VPTTIRNRAALVLVAVVAFGSTMAACSSAEPNLNGREFVAVEMSEGGVSRALAAGTRISLRFTGERLDASGGCNGLGGTYRIELGRLLYERGGQTLVGCDPPVEAQDAWLLDFLDSDPTMVLAGNELVLTSDAITMRLLDREVAEPDLHIVGPTWTVESIIEPNGASRVVETATATLLFKDDGTFDINAGCNRGSGRWEQVGGGIEVSAVGLTKMACGGAAGELEAAVLQVVGTGTLQASIDADLLTLSSGGRGLQLRG
jgi:heat shock protein HslJ